MCKSTGEIWALPREDRETTAFGCLTWNPPSCLVGLRLAGLNPGLGSCLLGNKCLFPPLALCKFVKPQSSMPRTLARSFYRACHADTDQLQRFYLPVSDPFFWCHAGLGLAPLPVCCHSTHVFPQLQSCLPSPDC